MEQREPTNQRTLVRTQLIKRIFDLMQGDEVSLDTSEKDFVVNGLNVTTFKLSKLEEGILTASGMLENNDKSLFFEIHLDENTGEVIKSIYRSPPVGEAAKAVQKAIDAYVKNATQDMSPGEENFWHICESPNEIDFWASPEDTKKIIGISKENLESTFLNQMLTFYLNKL